MSTPWERFVVAARRGEPDQVPVALIVDSPWLPGYAGISTLDYYLYPDQWLAINRGLLDRFPDLDPGVLVRVRRAVVRGQQRLLDRRGGAYRTVRARRRHNPERCMDSYDEIRQVLLDKQKELSGRLEHLKQNLRDGRSADSQEQAQELENAEVVDALGNETRLELSKIAKALDRHKKGVEVSVDDTAAEIHLQR